jgi:hypothetical protein
MAQYRITIIVDDNEALGTANIEVQMAPTPPVDVFIAGAIHMLVMLCTKFASQGGDNDAMLQEIVADAKASYERFKRETKGTSN